MSAIRITNITERIKSLLHDKASIFRGANEHYDHLKSLLNATVITSALLFLHSLFKPIPKYATVNFKKKDKPKYLYFRFNIFFIHQIS